MDKYKHHKLHNVYATVSCFSDRSCEATLGPARIS